MVLVADMDECTYGKGVRIEWLDLKSDLAGVQTDGHGTLGLGA